MYNNYIIEENKLNNELIEAFELNNQDYIKNNIDFIFSNLEFLEKLLSYLIKEKYNDSIIFLFHKYRERIPYSMIQRIFYDCITKSNEPIFKFYYENNIIPLNSDNNLPFILSCEYDSFYITKTLFLDQKVNPMDKHGKAFEKSVLIENTNAINLFFKDKDIKKQINLKFPVLSHEASKIILKLKIESF
jgi:hypothetical protein